MKHVLIFHLHLNGTCPSNQYNKKFNVKVWFQNRRMKWKRVKGTHSHLFKDKITGQIKPMFPTSTSNNSVTSTQYSNSFRDSAGENEN
ncbi:hypothetical protein KUTeg_015325 [Tegillarca granosa]|uniref:Homeobox domain-containing protein n=1 Tax=Tegillarca granosa TaxID=220873 RepID=A0ABQ9ETF2_TEGGR|nr:hypothetical protein KUTeg_015325 [Tegillarca granosa]